MILVTAARSTFIGIAVIAFAFIGFVLIGFVLGAAWATTPSAGIATTSAAIAAIT